jgi:ArsR family transcriptional regulator, arsenate/arsenite/antimonite-responsive transcriptional repressor
MGSPWKALSDDNRRRILLLLKEKDIITPTEIAEYFKFTMPGVSINLRILKEADLITKKRREKQIVLFEQKDNFRFSAIF